MSSRVPLPAWYKRKFLRPDSSDLEFWICSQADRVTRWALCTTSIVDRHIDHSREVPEEETSMVL